MTAILPGARRDAYKGDDAAGVALTAERAALAETLHRATCAEPWDACCWSMEDPDLTDCRDEDGAWRYVGLEGDILAAGFSLARPTPASAATTTETVEWSTWVAREQRGYDNRADAERRAERDGGPVIRRTRVSTADVVGEWEEVQ